MKAGCASQNAADAPDHPVPVPQATQPSGAAICPTAQLAVGQITGACTWHDFIDQLGSLGVMHTLARARSCRPDHATPLDPRHKIPHSKHLPLHNSAAYQIHHLNDTEPPSNSCCGSMSLIILLFNPGLYERKRLLDKAGFNLP